MTNTDTVAKQINLFPTDAGLCLRVYSQYDIDVRSCTEIASFVIPWHQLGDLVDRMERSEKSHVDVLAGISPY